MLKNPKVSTQKSVALACGVSRATVGAILAGGDLATRYSKATREHVLKTAARLHYRPHRVAQVLRKQRSNLIAIVHFGAGIETAHKSNLALSRGVGMAGYDYLAVDMNWHGGSVERTIEELIQARVEGVVISHIQEAFGEEHVAVLLQAGIPVVSINGDRRAGVSLFCDNVSKAFCDLTNHLIRLGRRRIVQLLPAADLADFSVPRAWRGRKEGFRTACEKWGTWQAVQEKDFSMNLFAGEDAVHGVSVDQPPRLYAHLERPVYHFCKRLFESGDFPDAIVCSNDSYAIELMMAAREAGVRVPEDLAVTGYDNDAIGNFPAIGLTTVEQDLENICTAGIRDLLERRNNPDLPAVFRQFDSNIVFRTSCGEALKEKEVLAT